MAMTATAAPTFDTGNPVSFFTNVANGMLALSTTSWFQSSPSNYLATYYGLNYPFPITISRFGEVSGLTNAPYFGLTNQIPNFGIGNIPVLVNGQFVYTPAIQRLLQLAANIYDTTTNKAIALGEDFPSVFRPTFLVTNESGFKNVYINGYEVVGSVSGLADPRFVQPIDAAILALGSNGANYTNGANVYGVPWIIGAKQGFPNFNEFSMENIVQISRKLQLTRTTNVVSQNIGGLAAKLTGTNQMYIFSITNYLGVECWNSYTNDYTNAVQIVVQDNVSMVLTNALVSFPVNYSLVVSTNINIWPGTGGWPGGAPAANSFVIPLSANLAILPNSVYRFASDSFVDVNSIPPPGFDTNVVPSITELPHFGLMATNRLRVIMLDGNHVIDYVQFAGPDSSRDLNAELADPSSTGAPAYLWSTNLVPNTLVPYGVANQISVSSGVANLVTPPDGGQWSAPPGFPANLPATLSSEAAFFHGFISPNSIYMVNGVNYTNTALVMQTPFTPTRTSVQYISWQANDPLVHYIASDLKYSGAESGLSSGIALFDSVSPPILPDVGRLNARYQPWGVNNEMAGFPNVDTNAFNIAYKDPLMWQSDDWDFPPNKLPAISSIGQVHRGTPWQTVYLKAANVLGANDTWWRWTGDANIYDAANSAPVQDRHLASLLTSLFNINNVESLFPVNNSNPNDWQGLLNGLTVWTNTLPNNQMHFWVVPQFVAQVISSNSLQASAIVNAVQTARTAQAGRIFHDIADILGTPQLSEQSPFLNWNSSVQQQYGISDEAYEIIPSQLLARLRTDSMGSVAFTDSQQLVHFTGDDGHAYAIQTSSDLVNWASISTNQPVNGVFSFTNSLNPNANQQFYRSVLLP